ERRAALPRLAGHHGLVVRRDDLLRLPGHRAAAGRRDRVRNGAQRLPDGAPGVVRGGEVPRLVAAGGPGAAAGRPARRDRADRGRGAAGAPVADRLVTAPPLGPAADEERTEYVEYRTDGSVAVITMNRPERLNALSRDTLAGLARAFMRFEADDETRVAVLTGTGRAFCVGMDMKEKAAHPDEDPAALPDISPLVNRFFPFRADDFVKPVIAAVNGLAIGGGVFLTVNSDLVVAAEEAQFEISEVKLGWVAGWWFGRLLNLPRH